MYVFWVVGFQNHLKAEIEVFITSIFLRILESEHSAFDHKVRTNSRANFLCELFATKFPTLYSLISTKPRERL